MRLLLILMFLTLFGQLRSQTIEFTDETTDITYTTRHLASQLEGTFKGVKGTAVLDSNNLAASFLKFAFATSTILQNDYLVGPNLLKASCFNPSQYPQIEVISTSISKLADLNKYLFTGTLVVKGISKPIAFPFTALPNVGGYDFRFTFPIIKKAFHLHCGNSRKFEIMVRGYGKKQIV